MREIRRTALWLLLIACLAAPLPGRAAPHPAPVWPVPDWSAADPREAGFDPQRLAAAVEAAFVDPATSISRRSRVLVVVRGGRLVAERYAPGIGPDTPLPGWSAAKTVTGALAGILVKERRLALDRPADVPAWRRPGDPRAAITLDHLLRMSSGLDFDETYDGRGLFRAGTLRMLLGEGRSDMAAYAADRPLAHPPGTRWLYSSGTSNVVSGLIRRAVEGSAEDYHAFPRRALFGPLGMRSAVVETDGAGTFVGSSYVHATARDWARLGLLYLRDGVWDGRRILPEGWVAYSRTPAPAAPHREYGAHVWLLGGVAEAAGDPALARGMPRDAFYAAGRFGQYVAVVPSLDLVVVRLGLASSRPFGLPDFLADLAAALR